MIFSGKYKIFEYSAYQGHLQVHHKEIMFLNNFVIVNPRSFLL